MPLRLTIIVVITISCRGPRKPSDLNLEICSPVSKRPVIALASCCRVAVLSSITTFCCGCDWASRLAKPFLLLCLSSVQCPVSSVHLQTSQFSIIVDKQRPRLGKRSRKLGTGESWRKRSARDQQTATCKLKPGRR